MLKPFKQKLALFLTILVIVTALFSTVVLAGGTEEEGTAGTITGGEINYGLDQDGYYPASFQYVMQNLQVRVTYENGTSEVIRYWFSYDHDPDYGYIAYNNYGEAYYIRFYDANDALVKFTADHVPIGEFTAKLNRGTEEPFYTTTVKILNPEEGTASGNSASFSSSKSAIYEETWYPITLTADAEYIFRSAGDSFNSLFAGVWTKNGDGTVSKLSQELSYQDSISYIAGSESPMYLVIGETYDESSKSGTVAWGEKRTVTALSINPAASYTVWDRDICKIPVTVTYSDGSTETLTDWRSNTTIYDGEDYHYVECMYATTSNADTIYLGAVKNDAWVDASNGDTLIPGTATWKAICEQVPGISATAQVTTATPNAKNITIAEGSVDAFGFSAGGTAAYQFTAERAVYVEILNEGSNGMSAYVFAKESGTNAWERKQSSSVSAGRTSTISTTAGYDYLVILTSDKGTSGSIGQKVDGSTKSAVLNTTTVDASDYSVWQKLSVTANFVCSDGVTPAGSQKIAAWSGNYGTSGTATARTKYYENIYYALYNGSERVQVPILSEEMMEYIGSCENEEEINMILQELGFTQGVDGLRVPAGTYTVKIYLGSIADANVIGTGTLKVTNSSAYQPPEVTSNPAVQKVKSGATATFTVKATGEELQYQWQYRTSANGTWKNATATGNKTATLKVPATTAKSNYQYRCKITDAESTVIYSKQATLYVLGIKTQPATVKIKAGNTATFTVSATGHNKTYQWQYRTSANGTWKNATATGNKTATLTVPATTARSSYQYRCVVKDSAGNVVNTNAATLYVLGIKTQPSSVQVSVGETAKFTVSATGHNKTYQWQYRTSAKGTWKVTTATGNKTATLKVPATTGRNGYQYRCVIKDSASNTIYSNAATLKLK